MLSSSARSESSGTNLLFHTPIATLQSSAFSPTLFVGEKVAEGRMRGRSIEHDACAYALFSISSDDARVIALRICSPLIRLPHLLPPQKKRGGKGLDLWGTQKNKE